MYNGIGLSSARGTGTSGHVVKNASSLRPGQRDGTSNRHHYDRDRTPKSKPLDKGIIDHERRRQVEVQCLELQDELEDQKLSDSKIEARVGELRARLLRDIDRVELTGTRGRIKPFETTQRAREAKSKENDRMARALRVGEDYAEGAAFDRELQELKRQKRLLERERDRAIEEERRMEREDRRKEREDRRKEREHRRRRSSRSRSPGAGSKSGSESDRESTRHSRRRRHDRSRRHHSRSRSRDYSGESYREYRSKRREKRRDDSTERRPSDDKAETLDPESNVRTVEDGEPGEIEDVEPISEQAEPLLKHRQDE
ncbi:hypothetical protein GGF43_004833 [Coemansia sp. RSA 2618]|nr:hypothetical protein GGF43_004833 [Coemansia sp. RSA 2618]